MMSELKLLDRDLPHLYAKLTGLHLLIDKPQNDVHSHRAGQEPDTHLPQPNFMVLQAQRLHWQRT